MVSDLHPGVSAPPRPMDNPLEGNVHALAEGQRLFRWFNCSGCHFNGGGGIGPALMDDDWIYGSEPPNIFATILEGRPNGMPSFRGRMSDRQAWQLVTFVRSLSREAGAGSPPQRPRGEQPEKKSSSSDAQKSRD